MKQQTIERLIKKNRNVSRDDLTIVRDMLRELRNMGVIKKRFLPDDVSQSRKTLIPDDHEPVLLNSRS